MNKLESIQENETYENYGDFDIRTDHLIPAIKLDLM